MLKADLIAPLKPSEGVTCSLLLKEGTDVDAFRRRFEATELTTLLGKGHYDTLTLQESYFNTTVKESNPCIGHRQRGLLSVGLLSALLILFIGCFNYINLSFSRLLGQVRARLDGRGKSHPRREVRGPLPIGAVHHEHSRTPERGREGRPPDA